MTHTHTQLNLAKPECNHSGIRIRIFYFRLFLQDGCGNPHTSDHITTIYLQFLLSRILYIYVSISSCKNCPSTTVVSKSHQTCGYTDILHLCTDFQLQNHPSMTMVSTAHQTCDDKEIDHIWLPASMDFLSTIFFPEYLKRKKYQNFILLNYYIIYINLFILFCLLYFPNFLFYGITDSLNPTYPFPFVSLYSTCLLETSVPFHSFPYLMCNP